MTGASKPLRVLLTRSEEDCAAWRAQLEHRGIAAVTLPCIAAEPIDSPALRAALRETAARADWLVFTSRRGVEAYSRLAGGEDGAEARAPKATPADPRSAEAPSAEAKRGGAAHAARPHSAANDTAGRAKIAAVGEATAQAARRRLGRADLVGGGTAEALAERLIEEIRRQAANASALEHRTVYPRSSDRRAAAHRRVARRLLGPTQRPPRALRCSQLDDLTRSGKPFGALVLLAVAENARDTLERALGAAGIECIRFDVYRTVSAAPQTAKRSLASLGVDAVLLASPSAAAGLVNQLDVDDAARLVTIGPSTSRAVRELGLGVAAEAREQSLAGLLEALENTYV